MSFSNKSEIKTFADERKQRQFIKSSPALESTIYEYKGLLQLNNNTNNPIKNEQKI